MTYSEWSEFAFSAWSMQIEIFAVYLTIATAYLAAAYAVGANLTRSQVIQINLVFVTVMLYLTFTHYEALNSAIYARTRMSEFDEMIPAPSDSGIIVFNIVDIFINLGILLICLKFMSDVRKAK